MSIFDIISTRGKNPAGQMDFIVPAVTPTPPSIAFNNVAGNACLFFNPVGNAFFALGDNLKFLSAWLEIDYGFGFGGPTVTGPTVIELAFWDGVGDTTIQPFPQGIAIPQPCDSIPLGSAGLFAPMAITGAKRRIAMTNFDATASLVNVPASLVGVTVNAAVYLAIEHNLPMLLI